MYLNEEDAFWALVALIGNKKYAMHGLLIPGLPKLLAYCDYHADMRKRLLPKLDRHLVRSVCVCVCVVCVCVCVCVVCVCVCVCVCRVWCVCVVCGVCVCVVCGVCVGVSHSHNVQPSYHM